jgi:hypothetical protein
MTTEKIPQAEREKIDAIVKDFTVEQLRAIVKSFTKDMSQITQARVVECSDDLLETVLSYGGHGWLALSLLSAATHARTAGLIARQ